ncbi:prostaglandin-H2 D-isomerase / glutathione transferase [Paragonimus westermani]|uniref:glutathione transferase n=2 Tax=Paragonimus westermani TaxID=34504 RepID=A0A5J4NS80_9TREM|nr:prostaglandin-H2 D-isomerase / glutathione transferase [Paragonimus westermani]
MSAPKYKLTYFNMRGLAERIRLVLHAADLEFEDHRLERSDWPAVKPTIEGGKLPVLDVTTCCGKTRRMNESMAIARWLARKYQMMGSNDDEYYEIERMIGLCSDIDRDVAMIIHATEDARPKLIEEFKEGNGPRLFGMMAKHLEASQHGLVTGNKATLADFCILCTIDQVESNVPGFLTDKFTIFQSHRERILKDKPKLADYLENRPKTAY